MDAQLKKGILDIAVLAVLIKKDSYGYELIKTITDMVAISESTLYPILRRLEKSGCLTTYNVAFDGRLRKYYKILPEGKEKSKQFCEEFKDVVKIYEFIRSEINE